MADEIRVSAGLSVLKRDATTGTVQNQYQAQPQAFQTDMDGVKGPCPGALTIPTGGKIVSLEELDTPGWCRLFNCDDENYCEFGVYVVASDFFIPLGEIGAGEGAVFKFSRNFRERYSDTGTGTTSEAAVQFMMKANTADVVVKVEAFDA